MAMPMPDAGVPDAGVPEPVAAKREPEPRELPTAEADARDYWLSAANGQLTVARCDSCGNVFHYPRPHCPTCWSDQVSMIAASGRATLYTYSTVYRNELAPFAQRTPYVAAVVELEEGPRLMTNIEDCEPAQLNIGMALVVAFRSLTDTVAAPVFIPA
jgi:uncharacterized protein